MELSGTVASGLGRAQIFMAQTHYQDQFREILGATAWPGTLNIELSGSDLESYRQLRYLAGLEEVGGEGGCLTTALQNVCFFISTRNG